MVSVGLGYKHIDGVWTYESSNKVFVTLLLDSKGEQILLVLLIIVI